MKSRFSVSLELATKEAEAELLALLQQNLEDAGAVATGYTKNHLKAFVEQKSYFTFVSGIRATTQLAERSINAIEFGRRAGKMPPLTPQFLDWMRARGIPEEKQFAVRKSIADHNIPGRFVLRKTKQQAQVRVQRIYARALVLFVRDFNNNR